VAEKFSGQPPKIALPESQGPSPQGTYAYEISSSGSGSLKQLRG